jgi:hypothetical protein
MAPRVRRPRVPLEQVAAAQVGAVDLEAVGDRLIEGVDCGLEGPDLGRDRARGHDLLHDTAERLDHGRGLATAEDAGVSDVPGAR